MTEEVDKHLLRKYEVAQKLYYEKVRGEAPPMDSSLKKRLADHADGGDGT